MIRPKAPRLTPRESKWGYERAAERSFGMCEGCGKVRATQMHHRLHRSHGGDERVTNLQRSDAIDAFDALDVSKTQLERRLQAPADKWTPNHMAQLQRVYTTITQDGIPATEFFPEQAVTVPQAGGEA